MASTHTFGIFIKMDFIRFITGLAMVVFLVSSLVLFVSFVEVEVNVRLSMLAFLSSAVVLPVGFFFVRKDE